MSLSKDSRDAQVANRLPKPLATLFEKFKSFQQIYPQFRLKVSVKGDPELAVKFFLKYDTQLMSNPVRQIRAHKSKLLNQADAAVVEPRPAKEKEVKPKEEKKD